jgi:cyanophycin synthetase
LANGVPAEQIEVIPDEQLAIDRALHEAEPGDLLLIFGDAITRSWKQVIQYQPGATPTTPERVRVSRPERVMVGASGNGQGDARREFVRDSRGVRVAREEAED